MVRTGTRTGTRMEEAAAHVDAALTHCREARNQFKNLPDAVAGNLDGYDMTAIRDALALLRGGGSFSERMNFAARIVDEVLDDLRTKHGCCPPVDSSDW